MSVPYNQKDDSNGVYDMVNLSPPPALPNTAHQLTSVHAQGRMSQSQGAYGFLNGTESLGDPDSSASAGQVLMNDTLNANYMPAPNNSTKLNHNEGVNNNSMGFNPNNTSGHINQNLPYGSQGGNSNARNTNSGDRQTAPQITGQLSMQQDFISIGQPPSYQGHNNLYLDVDEYLSDAEAAAFEADFLGVAPGSDLNPEIILSKPAPTNYSSNGLSIQGMNYLSPSNHLTINRGHKRLASLVHSEYDQATRVDYLDPKSPAASSFSSHSLYSDYLNNNEPTSPFQDAISHFSNNYSDLGDDENNTNSANADPEVKLEESYLVPSSQYNAPNSFDTEILLGGSISSSNLIGLTDSPQMTSPGGTPLEGVKTKAMLPEVALTVSNLNTFEQLQYTNRDPLPNYNADGIRVAINQAPEEVAAKTPSLFSNSSANSSIHDTKTEKLANLSRSSSNQNANLTHLLPNSSYLGNNRLSVEDLDSDLLNIDNNSVRRGRKKSISERSSSKSPLRNRSKSLYSDGGEEQGLNPISSREKMLELASPNQSSKRTQKHPSLFACDLCGKLFTRPYNLKSHYRTHTDERPFICSVCGKAFARQHDRKRHEDLHLGEKKFQCKGFLRNGSEYGCGRKFARADALRRHFQTEAGKNCIRLLVEEDALEKKNGGPGSEILASLTTPSTSSEGYLSPTTIPQVAISPPE
ncbi:DNA-binding transcription factor [Scheffersomyces spartinae]|uniref:pH-response transcription factor pacC/RIM101 n=1 Tax=Scheffersomyces spartinae TaxID=45513 RepID=A0A9P7V8J7_9ASCO|nr:DNA-binding transcription factor [Scheffersomyces spartinae]KAG7193405.1 DNA-binding transcription factor [Scheffersomyces spartinae]